MTEHADHTFNPLKATQNSLHLKSAKMELKLTLSLSSSSCFSQLELTSHSHGNVEARGAYECLNMQPLKKRKAVGDGVNVYLVKPKTIGQNTSLVGWPPVNKSRKKLGGGGARPRSMYVKVHMQGDGIARKVNLHQHRSYRTLIHTLANMFGKCKEDVTLTYQDKEGDWFLAGDLPWGLFVGAVKRLRLLKNAS